MIDTIKNLKVLTTGAMNDRKGVTALEYALIAAAVVAVVIAGYNTLFGKLQTRLNTITFQ